MFERKKRAHLDRRPTGDDSLASPPCQHAVPVGSFQYPQTAFVLLCLKVRPVGDEHLAVGLPPQRRSAAGRGEAADELLAPGSDHLLVERVDIAGRMAS